MPGTRIAGSIRDWINARHVRRTVRKQAFPDPLVRHHFDLAEQSRDEAALLHIGHMPVTKVETEPYVGVTIPALTNGAGGNLERRVQRRVASLHARYERRPEGRV